MIRGGHNLKDSQAYTDIALKDTYFPIAYNKTDKLITALYMITDILDKEEPLRTKLRTLGTEILSDTHSTPAKARGRIKELMSFLDIVRAMTLVSEMNVKILEKEFYELERSIEKAMEDRGLSRKAIDLVELLAEPASPAGGEIAAPGRPALYGTTFQKGRTEGARLGVQKGSTLLKALSGVESRIKDTPRAALSPHASEELKRQRREDILNIIRSISGGATIKDIKDRSGTVTSLNSCSDKTIQRELISLVKDGVLEKAGEKRWSRYSLRS